MVSVYLGTMTKNQQSEFERRGFAIEETGGGCKCLRKQLTDGFSLVITDGEAALPDLDRATLSHVRTSRQCRRAI